MRNLGLEEIKIILITTIARVTKRNIVMVKMTMMMMMSTNMIWISSRMENMMIMKMMSIRFENFRIKLIFLLIFCNGRNLTTITIMNSSNTHISLVHLCIIIMKELQRRQRMTPMEVWILETIVTMTKIQEAPINRQSNKLRNTLLVV